MKPIHECLLYRVGDDGLGYESHALHSHWWFVHPDDVPDLFTACKLMQIDEYCLFENLAITHGYSVQFNWVAYRLYRRTGKPEAYEQYINRMQIREQKWRWHRREIK